ncbi:hypothetical protein EXIGLDRAFT_837375 [Exidia glandulosa HHB12029]|uniref:TEA domain-containing protein n=1 Tax=Exidia glandulosa HHB12029 TaxID=1314781 RepID=A0A165GVN1_EXIGL|nr:hypothetical protein EXIGLDRAFT_837375 [Exidia glandulosa HHB12029]
MTTRPSRILRKRAGQVVWPPEDHPILVAAFKEYTRRKNEAGGRLREGQNAFLARYYSLYSGTTRTKEQVASHLQQLRKWHLRDTGRHWDETVDDTPQVSSPAPSTFSQISHTGPAMGAGAEAPCVNLWQPTVYDQSNAMQLHLPLVPSPSFTTYTPPQYGQYFPDVVPPLPAFSLSANAHVLPPVSSFDQLYPSAPSPTYFHDPSMPFDESFMPPRAM